jgi:hypothetical protein
MKKDMKNRELSNVWPSSHGNELNGSVLQCLGGSIDEHGNRVVRTKLTHPYSYDGFVLHRFGSNKESNGTIYSDRLLQWDFAKHDRLCMKHFGNKGQYWDNRDPKLIEAFLRDWCKDPGLRLILVMEYCNQASGYPCWRFDYKTSK